MILHRTTLMKTSLMNLGLLVAEFCFLAGNKIQIYGAALSNAWPHPVQLLHTTLVVTYIWRNKMRPKIWLFLGFVIYFNNYLIKSFI